MNKKNTACFLVNCKFIFFFALLLCLFTAPISAAIHLLDSVAGRTAYPWQKIELIADDHPAFVQEPFHPNSRHTHSSIKKAFKTDQPHSSNFLLHYAPNWNKNSNLTPVVLVHGAGDNASRGFTHPYTFDIPSSGKINKPGIMQHLVVKNGFPVFAVTFSHPHGDNFLQAQQLANAIKRVREITGAEKVDVVSHSKGAMSARIYASDLAQQYSRYNWITPYRGDIRKMMFIASPLKGIDTAFRYYMYNFTVMQQNLAAPMGGHSFLWMGRFVDLDKHNRMFPGQFQMLHNWVKDGIGFNHQSATGDMNYTRNALYNGGASAFLASEGIDKAIHRAGNVIEYLGKRGVHPDVQCHILAGTKQDIDTVKFFWIEIPIGEFSASSDGVVFLESATYEAGLTARGAKVKSTKILNTHHVGLTVLPAALNHIVEVLSERDTD